MAVVVTPLAGDRAAHNVNDFPELHASDLEENTPIHHVPAGSSVGDKLIWDGTKWTTTQDSATVVTLGTREGELAVGASPLKIRNLWGQSKTITKVFLNVATAPTGDDLICDVLIDNVSIFTSENKPRVAANATTGESTTFDTDTWSENSDLTWSIDQVGSSDPGENLVIHIVHVNA